MFVTKPIKSIYELEEIPSGAFRGSRPYKSKLSPAEQQALRRKLKKITNDYRRNRTHSCEATGSITLCGLRFSFERYMHVYGPRPKISVPEQGHCKKCWVRRQDIKYGHGSTF